MSHRPLWLILIGLLACDDDRLRDTLPPGVRIDSYEQQSASRIDVLWVVDNSGSMAPRQENLAKNFQSFIGQFTRNDIDFRIAVTTTDIFKDQGQLKGSPRILTPQTPNLTTAFGNNIRVGTSGSPYEAGLKAAQLALERQAQANATAMPAYLQCEQSCRTSDDPQGCVRGCLTQSKIDFLRPTAFLYLIFVTDEEDRSAEDVRYYWRAFETAKGIGNDGTVTTAAIIGDVPSNGCGATPGKRYFDLSSLTGGEVGSICDQSFSASLQKLASNAVGLKRKFALGQPPNPETIEVRIKYPCAVGDDVLAVCAESDRTDCEGQPGDAVGVLCKPVKGGPNGWTYEPENNVIFFAGDSVPGVRAKVEIQYYEEGLGP